MSVQQWTKIAICAFRQGAKAAKRRRQELRHLTGNASEMTRSVQAQLRLPQAIPIAQRSATQLTGAKPRARQP
jgi:hypothetical protein